MLLSLCMIVKNEEKNLSRCLESVKDIIDEMVIVDTGSTDATVKIAESYGASVYFFEWNENFSDARNFSISKAKGEWILIMDADDELQASDKFKIPPLLNNDNVDIYLFQTLSYVGKKNSLDTANNLFVRLIRNHKGYRYEGAIHEQIRHFSDFVDGNKVKIEEITVYHYGYLENASDQQRKSKRNIEILERLLVDNTEDNFHLFNMGNEYLRLRDYPKALHYYVKAYQNFMPNAAHSSKLLVRMIIALDALNMYEKEMEIIHAGLRYYPNFTDLFYLKASMLHKCDKLLLAIKEFHKCLEMGEPPLHLQFINDVWGYKSHYALGEIYLELEDYDQAYHHYVEAIKAKPDFYIPLYNIANILIKKRRDILQIRQTLERFFGDHINAPSYMILGDIFFIHGKYSTALEYFLKAEAMETTKFSKIFYYKGMCQLYLKNYLMASSCFQEIDKEDMYYEKAVYSMILCNIFSNNTDYVQKLFDITKDFKNRQTSIVYKTFQEIIDGKNCPFISEDKEESKQFADIIFDLLSIVLKACAPEMFEKSLQLLNLIENDEGLLRLAKLYYLNEYNQLAYQEFIRSIKIFDKIDEEGLAMMREIFRASRQITI
ncbi:MAG: glycosyltransferase [Bacillota bacterium]